MASARARKNLSSQYPLYWHVQGDGGFLGSQRNALVAAIRRRLAKFHDLSERPGDKGATWVDIHLNLDSIAVRVRGGPGGILHYSDLGGVDSSMVDTLSADVVTGLGFELAPLGAALLATDLFESVVGAGHFIAADPDVAGSAMFQLAKHNRVASVIALLDRTYFAREDSFAGPAAIAALHQASPSLNESLARRLQERFTHAAASDRLRAGEFFYNAANMMRSVDPTRAQELYERAAESFPGYRERSYWWQERAGVSFHQGKFTEATERYQEALRLGSAPTIPYLAHAQMWAGDYKGSLATLALLKGGDVPAFWWAMHWGLLNVVNAFGVDRQDRDSEAAAALSEGDRIDPKQIEAALAIDLLDPNALEKWGWLQREEGNAHAHLYALAAVMVPTFPMGWYQAFAAAFEEAPDMAPVMLAAGLSECGGEFRNFVLEEESIPEEIREPLLEMLDTLPVPEPPTFVLRVGGVPISDLS